MWKTWELEGPWDVGIWGPHMCLKGCGVLRKAEGIQGLCGGLCAPSSPCLCYLALLGWVILPQLP